MSFDTFTLASIAIIIVVAIALYVSRQRKRQTCKEMADYIDSHKG
jgi:hypothetical protein